MEEIAFLKKLEPSEVEIAGTVIRLHFTLHAAARMEQELGKPYYEIVAEMLERAGENGQPSPPMALDRQLILIRILMEEAGQRYDPERLQELHMLEFARLARAAQREMLYKSPRSDAKKKPVRLQSPLAGPD